MLNKAHEPGYSQEKLVNRLLGLHAALELCLHKCRHVALQHSPRNLALEVLVLLQQLVQVHAAVQLHVIKRAALTRSPSCVSCLLYVWLIATVSLRTYIPVGCSWSCLETALLQAKFKP